MFSRKKFSDRLVGIRKQKGVSQTAVAEYAGIGRTSVTMLEKGENSPSIEVVCLIADYFNVSIDYLVGRSDDPERR